MAAQRATAAEKTAPAGSMELLGDVLRLGRGGSGCRVSGGPGGPGAVDLMGGAPWCGAQCEAGMTISSTCLLRDVWHPVTARVVLGAAPASNLPLRSSCQTLPITLYRIRAVVSAPRPLFHASAAFLGAGPYAT